MGAAKAGVGLVGWVSNEVSFAVDGILERWKSGKVKTTLDLPADVVREMKLRAVREGRKLRDVAEEVFRRGMAAPANPRASVGRRRVPLPIIPVPVGATPFEVSGERLLELEMDAERGDDQ